MKTPRYLRARHSLPVESPDILHNGHRYRHVPFLPERRPAATGRIKTDWQLGNIQAAAPMPLTSPGNDDDTGENHQPTLRKNTAEPVEQTLKQNSQASVPGHRGQLRDPQRHLHLEPRVRQMGRRVRRRGHGRRGHRPHRPPRQYPPLPRRILPEQTLPHEINQTNNKTRNQPPSVFKLNADGVRIKCRTRPPQFDEIQPSAVSACRAGRTRSRRTRTTGRVPARG